MNLIDNYSLLTPQQKQLLTKSASQSFNIGGYKSLDDILTSLNVDVIIEPGVVTRSIPSDLDAIEHYWREEVSRIKREIQKDRSNIDVLELDKAQGKVNIIQREKEALSTMPLRGLYEPQNNLIKLFPDEMRSEYGGKCMDELLVSTLAHETMHTYFNRPGHYEFPYLICVEEPLAEFGMLLYLKETGSSYYQWAYNDVKSKKTCYGYGADLMDQHLKESPKSSIFCYLEEYKIDLEYYQMPDFVGGTIVMPSLGKIKLTKISGGTYKIFSPRCRFASFDLCYGYFQTHRGSLTIDMERSCLHLWSYLASWGMLRGSSKLLSDCSMKVMEDVVTYLSTLKNPDDWELDLGLDASGAPNPVKSKRIIDIYKDLSKIIGEISVNSVKVGVSATPTLVTKIMLGTLGCVPALDRYFIDGLFKTTGEKIWSLTDKSLECIQDFYKSSPTYPAKNTVMDTATSINPNTKIKVIDFDGNETEIFYPRAKVLDMIGFSLSAGWTWQIIKANK